MLNELDKNQQVLTKRYLTARDAYVTGYFFTTIDNIPPYLPIFMRENYDGDWTEDKIIKTFTALSMEIFLPQETLKTTHMPGRGGLGRTLPLFSQPGNVVNVNFLVDQNLEISTLITGWYQYIALMADGRLKINQISSMANIYGCNFYYCTLLPNMRDLVFAFVAESFYPTSNVIQDFSHVIGTTDTLRHSVPFNIDYYDYWTKGRRDMNWLKLELLSKIELLRVSLNVQAMGEDYLNAVVTDGRTLKADADYSMKDPGRMEFAFARVGKADNVHFGQTVPDRFGNRPDRRNNDGSVHDKFTL